MAITAVGESQPFNYTGGIQTFTAPFSGIYKLEVYGAQGGTYGTASGGKGGYSYGNVTLTKGQTLYVCVGGAGQYVSKVSANVAGGYNGGGYASGPSPYSGPRATGGGLTHIAKVAGTLQAIGKTSAITNGNLLICAGGGGGAGYDTDSDDDPLYYAGGAGGGAAGGSGSRYTNKGYAGGGTQSAGGTSNDGGYPGFGYGAPNGYTQVGCGGGGLYGGGGCSAGSAGGGSGYIGGVTNGGTSRGIRSGNGYALITLVEKSFPTVYFDGIQLDSIIFNGVAVESIIFDGQTLN